MGGPAVAGTAMAMCSFGVAPATLVVLPLSRVMVEGKPAATIADAAGAVNLPTFGMCLSLANPTVAAATAAALGVLTPMPCVPATAAWISGATRTMIGGKPALAMPAQCLCPFGGVVQILNPQAVRTTIG